MKNMNIPLVGTLLGLSLVVCPLLYIFVGPALTTTQISTLRLLCIIALCSALLCFALGQLTGNNSQVDKIWSILPFVYCWIIAFKGGFSLRLVVMAILATLWGIRLTFNFARKGAYRWRFWEGEEDYRWKILRQGPVLNKRWAWLIFNLLFICLYQNALLLLIVLPALVSLGSNIPFSWFDILAAAFTLFFIVLETVADEQQWRFQSAKWSLIRQGRTLESLPLPYRRGFNTEGLWSRSRHPNYLAEQSIWLSLYLFSIASGAGILNWSLIGALLLMVMFSASSSFAESISAEKYPEYSSYQAQVNRFIPGKKYNPSDAKA